MSNFDNRNLRWPFNTGNRDKLRDALNRADNFIGDSTNLPPATISAAGAIDLTKRITLWSLTGTQVLTLANGSAGQRLVVRLVLSASTPIGSIVVNKPDGTYTTITAISVVGTSIEFLWSAAGWSIGATAGTLTIG